MKNRFFKHTLLTALCLLLGAAFARAATPISVAVLDFDADNADNADYGADLATLLAVDLSLAENLAVVERADLAKILSEQEIGLSGAVDSATAAKIGHLTGAQVIIMGRVLEAGGATYLVAKAFSTETSRVFGGKVKMKRGEAPDEAISQLADSLSASIVDNRDAIVVKAPDAQALSEQLTKLTAGRTLPRVKVTIPEAHIGQPVPDPAAQTELVRLLKAAGFTVIDEQTGGPADVEITGEAFSETGMRFRNLDSCTARVEIKVTNTHNGEIILADAKKAVALDLAEHIAGKTALQEGAALLAPSVVEAIVTQYPGT